MLAKVDHIVFKQNGYIAIDKGDKCPERQAVQVSSHDCRLGKWYFEGIGQDEFSSTSAYSSLETPHAIVHQQVQRAVELIEKDWISDQDVHDQLIESIKNFESASTEVMTLMDDMVEQKHQS